MLNKQALKQGIITLQQEMLTKQRQIQKSMPNA